MTGRERVKAAMHFKTVDKAPLQYYYTPVGYYEHGEKLNDLYENLPGDFEPFHRMPITGPKSNEYDTDGNYHSFRRDGWGTLWEYRIFGITGIPKEYPLEDLTRVKDFAFPIPPASNTLVRTDSNLYSLKRAGDLYERMIALRPEEDVLCDILMDEPEIHLLADKIIEYDARLVENAIAEGADGIVFGDDYGAEKAMLMSPDLWRSFFKPRLKQLFAPAVTAGLDIHFHSCGMISPILEDFCEIGVTSIWPQLPAYNMKVLAERCRSLGLAVAIHTDRANTMTYGTPETVRDLVKREFETFRMMQGGSWFYVEADNGFPFENIEALIETIAQWR